MTFQRSLVFGLCLCCVGFVSAQDRTAPLPSNTPIPCDQRAFSIPFEIRNNGSADPPIEVELLYSTDYGTRWFSGERQPVDAKKFEFKAPGDGEYWFSFRTITLSGRIVATNQGGPNLRVLVDTKARGSFEPSSVPGNPSTAAPSSSTKELSDAPPKPDQKPNSVNSVVPDPKPIPEQKSDPTAPVSMANRFVEPTVMERPVSRGSESETPIVPPKPLRMQVRKEEKKKSPAPEATPTDDGLPMLAEPQRGNEPSPSAPASAAAPTKKSVAERPLPTLFAPTGELVPVKSVPERTTAEKPKPTIDPLLAEMNRFYEGQIALEPKTVQPKAKTAAQTPGASPATAAATIAANKSVPMPSPTTPEAVEPPKNLEARRTGPGSINGVALEKASGQPRMVVRWNSGGETLQTAFVDVLRGESLSGPWLPIATNLANSGEYWWFITKDDFKPFHIAVRLRTVSGTTLSDATVSPIRLNPSMVENADRTAR